MAAGAGREASDFTPTTTWPDAGGKHGLRGGRLRCHWATWPPVVGRRANEGGGCGPRGERLYCYCDLG